MGFLQQQLFAPLFINLSTSDALLTLAGVFVTGILSLIGIIIKSSHDQEASESARQDNAIQRYEDGLWRTIDMLNGEVVKLKEQIQRDALQAEAMRNDSWVVRQEVLKIQQEIINGQNALREKDRELAEAKQELAETKQKLAEALQEIAHLNTLVHANISSSANLAVEIQRLKNQTPEKE